MGAIRLNITLPEELSHRLDSLIGPRRKSRFIAEALEQKMAELEHKALLKKLEEGYKASRKEAHELTKSFENVDLEGWDEY
jgi:metal-responsive CopG/Arc/MetJ family transcriptional regulator